MMKTNKTNFLARWGSNAGQHMQEKAVPSYSPKTFFLLRVTENMHTSSLIPTRPSLIRLRPTKIVTVSSVGVKKARSASKRQMKTIS